jgi:hypothetical protein
MRAVHIGFRRHDKLFCTPDRFVVGRDEAAWAGRRRSPRNGGGRRGCRRRAAGEEENEKESGQQSDQSSRFRPSTPLRHQISLASEVDGFLDRPASTYPHARMPLRARQLSRVRTWSDHQTPLNSELPLKLLAQRRSRGHIEPGPRQFGQLLEPAPLRHDDLQLLPLVEAVSGVETDHPRHGGQQGLSFGRTMLDVSIAGDGDPAGVSDPRKPVDVRLTRENRAGARSNPSGPRPPGSPGYVTSGRTAVSSFAVPSKSAST